MPFYFRFQRIFQQLLRKYLRYLTLSRYAFNLISEGLPLIYMLFKYISPKIGEILLNIQNQQQEDLVRRQNLFRGIARLILSLARVFQPRISLFEFYNNGIIILINRLLPCFIIILENNSAPRIISRNEIYTFIKPFIIDMLIFYNNFFLSNLRAILSIRDYLR